MGFVEVTLIVLYVFICFFLILVVLLQQGKGADIAGAFGGGGTQTAFGARGATTLLHKLTTAAFIGFILIAMALVVLQARHGSSSVMKGYHGKGAAKAAPAQPAPAQPAPAQQAPAPQQAPAAPAPEPAKK